MEIFAKKNATIRINKIRAGIFILVALPTIFIIISAMIFVGGMLSIKLPIGFIPFNTLAAGIFFASIICFGYVLVKMMHKRAVVALRIDDGIFTLKILEGNFPSDIYEFGIESVKAEYGTYSKTTTITSNKCLGNEGLRYLTLTVNDVGKEIVKTLDGMGIPTKEVNDEPSND